MKSNYLVCYDIALPKRLSRVFRFMKGIGIHLQYSVFHCSLEWHELTALKANLEKFIEKTEDDIRVYPLPSDCNVIIMGRGGRVPGGVKIFIQ